MLADMDMDLDMNSLKQIQRAKTAYKIGQKWAKAAEILATDGLFEARYRPRTGICAETRNGDKKRPNVVKSGTNSCHMWPF